MKKIHFIGIEGCAMSGMAHILLKQNNKITGSDLTPGLSAKQLSKQGAVIYKGHNKKHLDKETDLVIISAAIKENNPELAEARKRNVPVLKYAEMLGKLMSGNIGIAVAGTHGKSTTSGLMAYMMHKTGMKPNYVIGAKVRQLKGNSGIGSSPYFVAEACEYDKSFLQLNPKIGIITNIELDHLDCYKNIQEISQAFTNFAKLLPQDGLLVVEKEAMDYLDLSQIQCEIQSYSLNQKAQWYINKIYREGLKYKFEVFHNENRKGLFSIKLAGRHNISNALATIAVAFYLNIPQHSIQNVLQKYTGVNRRFEILSTCPVTIIDDYAHHPTEIKAVLRGLREYAHFNKIWCVFQPHQASRTYHLLKDFSSSFELADEVVLSDIYFARDSIEDRNRINSQILAENIVAQGKNAYYMKSFNDIENFLKNNVTHGDVIITLGAGDIYKIAHNLKQFYRFYRPITNKLNNVG